LFLLLLLLLLSLFEIKFRLWGRLNVMSFADVVSRLKTSGPSKRAALNDVVLWLASVLKGQIWGDSLKGALASKADIDGVVVLDLADVLEAIVAETPGTAARFPF
jgi:hypothetical protein